MGNPSRILISGRSHKKSWFTPCVGRFQIFNVYGFGERHKGTMACSPILNAYDQVSKGGPLRLFRSHKADVPDGHQTRDFVSVEMY